MTNALKPITPHEKTWGMFVHLSALLGLLLPLGLVLGPLIVWLLKRKESRFIDEQGKRAVNFQLTILIIAFVIGLLSTIIRPLLPIAFMVGLAALIFAAMAGVSIYNGKDYRYPFSFTFMK